MAPDLFELLGVRASGRGFELLVWSLAVLAGGLLLVRERIAGRGLQAGAFGWGIGALLIGFGLWRWLRVAVYGELFFGPRGLIMPTYGVLMGVGFGLGAWLVWREAERLPGEPSGFAVLDLGFWVLVGSLLGARLLFMLTRVEHYVALCASGEDCLAFLRVWEGGLVFYGGVIGAWVAGALWCRRRGISFLRAADLFAPALALGHAIGRVGCYAASCCYGARTTAGHGVHFPAWSSPFNGHLRGADASEREWLLDHMHSHAVIPVQLWEAAGEIAIFLLLVGWVRARKRYHGQVLVAWAGAYAVLRFGLEMVRDDAIRGFLFEVPLPWLATLLGFPVDRPLLLTTSQAIALGMAAGAIGVDAVLRRRARGGRTREEARWAGGN